MTTHTTTSIEAMSAEAMTHAKAILRNEYDQSKLGWAENRIWIICNQIGGSRSELLNNAKTQLSDEGHTS
jgi:hypothetical protein